MIINNALGWVNFLSHRDPLKTPAINHTVDVAENNSVNVNVVHYDL